MGTMIIGKPVLAALALLGSLVSGEVEATSLEISPVTVHLVSGQNATTIEVMNRGGVAAAIQLRAYAWAQDGNEDVLTPTQDIILSPPIFTIAKGGSQTIRLLLRNRSKSATERSFRLLIDEVPAASSAEQQINIAMRVSLPVMAAASTTAARSLEWRAQRGAGGQIRLSATNVGNAHDRIHSLAVTLADGTKPKIALGGTNSYILAGARRSWVVQGGGGAAGNALRLSVITRAGKSEQVLALAP